MMFDSGQTSNGFTVKTKRFQKNIEEIHMTVDTTPRCLA
jgi:hypothetical protein